MRRRASMRHFSMRHVVMLWVSMAQADVTADFDAFEVERRAKAAIDMAGCPERTQWQQRTVAAGVVCAGLACIGIGRAL